MKILLGSQSKFRRELMAQIAEQLGATFEMTTADIDEKAIRDADPRSLVVKLALAKTDVIALRTQLCNPAFLIQRISTSTLSAACRLHLR